MDSGYDEHAAAQDYVVSLLRYYGFDARKEVWISGGRIDIAGRCVNRDLCKSYSVAIEVSRTSDLAKDLDRLSKASYDLKFVVLLKPYGELPSIFGNIWITRLERLEHLLRWLLDIHSHYPLFSGEKPKLIIRPAGGKLEEFKRYIAEELGLPELVEKSLKFILRVYALREALVKTVYIPPYSTQQYVDAYEDIRMVNLLDKIGVIKFRDCRAYTDGKIYLASLSAYGEELACSLAQKVILSNEAKIRDEMRRYGVIIPFITSILRCSEIEELKWEYVLSRITYGTRWIYYDTLKSRVPPEVYLFAENSYNLPKVRSKCIEFAGRFEELHLAFRGRRYGSKGKYYGDEICMVPELAEYIFNSLKDEALRKLDESGLMKEFNTVLVTYVITHMNVNPVEVLVDFKVSYEDMKRLIQTLHGKGVTSKFLDKQPYVIVVDVEAFDKEIVEILKELEDKLISL